MNLKEISGTIDVKLRESKEALEKATSAETAKSEVKTWHEKYLQLDAEVNDLKVQEELLLGKDRTEAEIKARGEATNLPNRTQPKGDNIVKSLAEMFIESSLFKSNRGKWAMDIQVPKDRIEGYNYINAFKSKGTKANTLLTDTTLAGVPTFEQQLDIYIPSAQRIPTILPYIPMLPITSDSYTYRRETGFTNGVGTTAEGSALSQSDFKAETVTGTIHTVGHYLKVSVQELNDVPRMALFLNQNGQLMIDQGLESQCLTGNGIGENFTGYYNASGIGTYACGSNNDNNGNPENNIDALWRGIVALRTTGRCHPSLIVMHDNNLTPIVLLKNGLGDYIYGEPSSNSMLVDGESNTFVGRVWGLPLQNTTAAVADTALIGDFARFSALAMRQGLEVSVEKINDDVIKLLRTLVMFTRGNLEVYRGGAFEKITNLAA